MGKGSKLFGRSVPNSTITQDWGHIVSNRRSTHIRFLLGLYAWMQTCRHMRFVVLQTSSQCHKLQKLHIKQCRVLLLSSQPAVLQCALRWGAGFVPPISRQTAPQSADLRLAGVQCASAQRLHMPQHGGSTVRPLR